MPTIITALFAASIAYVFNTLIIKKLGISVLTDIVPIGEEFIKTFLAVKYNAHIISVHLIFGTVEALSDFYAGEKTAAAMSVISHGLFGLLAVIVYNNFGLWWSIVSSAAFHMTYNRWMLSKVD